ncbi:hypothetical protein B0H14DRAFT_2739249 [Mycena olivaceomarginata]|nr:hypothetical protein B0H14DRAFT_2739249 [Mycena olivaceomarginata]
MTQAVLQVRFLAAGLLSMCILSAQVSECSLFTRSVMQAKERAETSHNSGMAVGLARFFSSGPISSTIVFEQTRQT